MLVTTHLADIVSGTCGWVEQVGDQVVYANKIDKKECEIFWNDDAILIDRRIRGLSPKPAAWFSFLGERIRILDSVYEKDVDMSRSEGVCHGTVLDDSLLISCQRGAVRLLKLQRSGKQVLHVQDFLRGFPIKKGTILVSLG
jgi:methionyl-tRNA formyltransferase